jgi:glycosyltransferase involved in cell wall biosynthesis
LDPLKETLAGKHVAYFFDFVDLSPFRNLGEEKVVLFVGFPFKLKGVDLLIAAFKRVAAKYPDWKLKILGWFPDPSELNAHIDGHSQIFHHPPVDYPAMPSHVGACGVLALPSRTEGLSRVLIEGMACEKPRLASRVDGNPFLVEDGADGLLFESGNARDLAEKLDRLMGDPALRASLGRAAAARAAREFSYNTYFDGLISFYSAVIEGRKEP